MAVSLFSSGTQLSVGHHLGTGIDSSHRGLSADAAVALEAYVALATHVRDVQSKGPQSSARGSETALLAPLALQATRSPLFTKPPLSLLSAIVPTLSTGFLDAHASDLLDVLIDQSSERHLAQPRGRLLAVLVGHHLDSPVSPTTKAPAALQDALLSALLKDDPVLRLNLNQTTLRQLAETHPTFIAGLVNRLILPEAGASIDFANHERREEAWLSLVTLGNGVSLCDDIRTGGQGQEGKIALPLEVVLGCLSHPTPAVKLGAYSLVTDKPAINSPLSEGEVVVVKRFLEAAINTGESE